MKLVIDIPEVYFEVLKKKTVEIVSRQRSGKTFMSVICEAVAKGTPLPKGHGNLIDADELYKEFEDRGMSYEGKLIKYAKPVIEAESEAKE